MSRSAVLEAPGQAAPVAPADGPRTEYVRRLGLRRKAIARLEWWDARLADARLALFAVGLFLAWLGPWTGRISAGWLAVPAAGFAALVVVHDLVGRRLRQARRGAAFYERALARVEDRWAGGGTLGTRYQDEAHPYAADLDLFGDGSLFDLLCTARTRVGEDTLAGWLKQPAAPVEIRQRQEAVAELRPRLDLREDLALLGNDIRAAIDPEALVAWATRPPVLTSRAARWAARVLGTLGLIVVGLWLGGIVGLSAVVAVGLVEAAFALAFARRVREAVSGVERAGQELSLIAGLLARIERESFTSGYLQSLHDLLVTRGEPASRRIAALSRLIHRLDARHNTLLAPIAAAMLWTTRLAFAIEAWRARSGREVGPWLDAIGRFEALAALAAFAYEHPDDPFPELVEDEPGPILEGVALGHPLLPESRCVRNDLALGGGSPALLLVSGSNMSGKSTLLRTAGINAVLAQAGATVRARSLRMTPLRVGATLRVQDSLQAGRSRFFAEIARLKQLVDLAGGAVPLLFLLDEVLHGTNSHDRRVGAETVLRKLLDLGAIGLATTHDLALAEIADALAPRAANVHFADHFEDGAMVFDYTMRPGVVAHSNALALMRSVGLEV